MNCLPVKYMSAHFCIYSAERIIQKIDISPFIHGSANQKNKTTNLALCLGCVIANRVGQSLEIYSNSVPLSPPHWPYPKRIRPPSWPRVAVASSIQNTKLFTWRTWSGAGAVPKCDWAARSQCGGSKQRRADHIKYIWYIATHDQYVITTELMIA